MGNYPDGAAGLPRRSDLAPLDVHHHLCFAGVRLWQEEYDIGDDMWVLHVILYKDGFERPFLGGVAGENNKK